MNKSVIQEEMAFRVREGWCTITYTKEVICPHCHQKQKTLHQPIRFISDYMVCGGCYKMVCEKIDKLNFDRSEFSSDFDVSKIPDIRNQFFLLG